MGADRGIHVEVTPAEMETLQPFHVRKANLFRMIIGLLYEN